MAHFDRFDICEAYHLYASDFHGGQWSKEYRIFGQLERIGFRPAPSLSRRSLSKDDRQNVRDILAGLIRDRRAAERYRRNVARPIAPSTPGLCSICRNVHGNERQHASE